MRGRYQKTERSAQITVFVSMVLVVILTLLCTSLESARVSALRYYMKTAAESSMFSLFSEYHRTLLDRYHLFFLEDDGNLEQTLKEYLAYYENPSKDLAVSGLHFYQFQTESVQLTGRTGAVDRNGLPFETEILEYMKYGMAESLVEQVKKLLQAGGQCQKMTGAIHQIAAMSDDVFALEDSYLQLKENGQELKTAAEHVASELEEVKTLMREKQAAEEELNARQAGMDGLEGAARAAAELELISVRMRVSQAQEQLDTAADQAQRRETALRRAAEQADACLEQITAYTERFQKQTEPILAQLEQMEEQLTEPFTGIVRQQKDAVSVYTEENGERKMLATTYGQSVEALEDSLEGLPEIREAVRDGAENVLEQKISAMRGNGEIPWPETLQTIEAPAQNNFLKEVGRLMDQGVLALVLGPDTKVSERVVEGEDLPSVGRGEKDAKEDDRNADDSGVMAALLEGLYENLCLNEYAVKTMPSLLAGKTDDEENGFYDLEYILGNSSADRDNLATVMERLLLLREGMNLVFLYGDRQKTEEAQMLALTLTGAVGLTPLAGLVKVMILAAWAFAESVTDVRTLAGGGKVPFIKQASDWQTSLERVPAQRAGSGAGVRTAAGVDSELRTEKESDEKGENNTGMGYEDYIRLLLCFVSKEKKLYRCMDMVQWNIRQEEPAFLLKNCLYQVDMQAAFQADQMFVTLPFMGADAVTGGQYAFVTMETRSYGEMFEK